MRAYLRNLRENMGMSVRDVAHATGWTFSAYSHIENGRRQLDMTLSTMKRLADVFDTNTEDILHMEMEYQRSASRSA